MMEHSVFIWSAYGAAAMILLWTAASPLFRLRRALREVRMQHVSSTAGEPLHDTDA